MHQYKTYSLCIKIQTIFGTAIQQNRLYSLTLSNGQKCIILKSDKINQAGKIIFNQSAEFQFEQGTLNLESKLFFVLKDETDHKKQQIAKLIIFVMDSKSYTQKIFTMNCDQKEQIALEMRVSMNSYGQTQQKHTSNIYKNLQKSSPRHKKTISLVNIQEKAQLDLSRQKIDQEVKISTFSFCKQSDKREPQTPTLNETSFFKLLLPITAETKTNLESSLRVISESFQDIQDKWSQLHLRQTELDSLEMLTSQEGQSGKLRIWHNISFFHAPTEFQSIREKSLPKKRYQLVKEVEKDISNDNEYIRCAHTCQYNENYQTKINETYIKLNRIANLSQTLDIAKKKNDFLVKVNQELKNALQQTQSKLKASKNIPKAKDQLLNQQFKLLKTQIDALTNQIIQKNVESMKKDDKIKQLQMIVEQYTRDINKFKAQLKEKESLIHEMRIVLSTKEQSDDFSKGSRVNIEFNNKYKESSTKMISEFGKQKETTFLSPIKKANSFDQRRSETPKDKNNEKSELRIFRKFSHSKNQSYDANQMYQSRKAPSNSTTDLIFDKLAMLCTGIVNNNSHKL